MSLRVRLFQNSCMECTRIDDMYMVQCDDCDKWAHYQCVGVGSEIENLNWCCRFCRVTSMGNTD